MGDWQAGGRDKPWYFFLPLSPVASLQQRYLLCGCRSCGTDPAFVLGSVTPNLPWSLVLRVVVDSCCLFIFGRTRTRMKQVRLSNASVGSDPVFI